MSPRKVNRPNPPKATAKRREAFLRQAERAITVHLINGIKSFKAKIPKAKLDDMYRDGKYDEMFRTLPWPVLEKSMQDGDARLARTKVTVGQHTIDAIGVDEADKSVSLDYVADRVLGQRRGKPTDNAPEGRLKRMVPDIKGEAREHLKEVVARGNATGMTPRAVSNQIIEGLGINDQQSRALKNFRKGLEQDGKYSQAHIDSKVAIKEKEMVKQRALTIAITETHAAANSTELKSWQAQQQSGLLSTDAMQTWLAEPDACAEICKPMDGTSIGLNDVWVLPDGRTTPYVQGHPRCRCQGDVST